MISKYKKIKSKKAIFLTVSLVLFTLILFSLSSLFIKQKQSENFFVQGSIDRIVNLDSSIQNSITKLFDEYSGIDITINSNKIKITETLPPSFTTFNSKLSAFESFLESEFSIVELKQNIQDMPLNLTPKGILYTHKSGEQKVLIKNAVLATSFEIKFTFPQGEEGVCSDPIVWNSEFPGTLRIKVLGEDLLSSCNSEKFVDPSDSGGSEVEIPHTKGNIRVIIRNNEIEISRTGSNVYIAETTIELPPLEEIVSIKMPEILTNVSLKNFRITGEARFLT